MTSFVAYTRGDEVAYGYTTKVLANLTFEWNISEFEKIMDSAVAQDSLKLDNVQVGETNWDFRLFPNDNSRGDVAIFCYPNNQFSETAKVSFSVIGNNTTTFESKKGNGFSLMSHEEIKENSDILSVGSLLLLIKVTVLTDAIQNDDLIKRFSILSMKKVAKSEKMKISRDFKEGWIDDNFSDVHIKCEEEVFYCHKFILAKRSKYFRAMLGGAFKESEIKIIEMKEIEVNTLRAILKFLYGGEIEKLDENAVNLLEASEMLQLEDLKKVCETYLLTYHMNLENAIDMLVIAEAHGASDLKKGAMKIVVKNSAAIIKQEGWKDKLIGSSALLLEVFEALAKK